MIKSSEWFPDLDAAISSGDIKSFPSKKAALEYAKEYKWIRAVRVERRFENVWIIGLLDFQPDDENGILFDVLRVPMLRWIDGVQPVVKFRKPRMTI